MSANFRLDTPARVVVIGARGIGRHHAKWWRAEGAEVVAFAGSSPDLLESTRLGLLELFPFDGRAYSSAREMIETEQPDIVDVCSPPELHFEHVSLALDAGCAVLCEKPFVYDASLPGDTLRDQARALISSARQKGQQLAVSAQYSEGARVFNRLWRERRPNERVRLYHGHLEAPAKGRAPDPRRIWSDLSPHPLSVLLALAPDGELAVGSLRATFQDYEASAEFDYVRPTGESLHASVMTRNALRPPLNVRHFKYNEYTFAVEGENDVDGTYRARIETSDGNSVEPDMMRALIGEFLAGESPADLDVSYKNLDLMLRILEFAEGGRR
jgi:predicted dehydrogenase